ncbi:MAG: recombinase RecT [Clostridia bacterium]|jgi:recombination protein RecT|nr:recombinase RecT [Clostridia bacterium]
MTAQKDKKDKNDKALQPSGNKVLTTSERFTNQVLKEFGSNISGAIQVTDYQKQLIQGYFIGIDRALKIAEDARVRKNNGNKDHEKYDNNLPVVWNNVNLNDLALDVVHYARMGLDMMQGNHISPIPYKNNKTQKYDITLMPGYNGIQYIAEKYAVEPPAAVTVELVYDSDTFKPIKKDANNKTESYEFIINNPFDRGSIVGGFGYIEYTDTAKNELIIMTLKDIEKRKPRYAASEFWGGKKTEWVDGKKTETDCEGWFEEMCLKTIKREVYSAKHIPRDPKKVDDNYQYMKLREAKYAEMETQSEIDSNANAVIIDTTEISPKEPEKPSIAMQERDTIAETASVKEPLAEPNF